MTTWEKATPADIEHIRLLLQKAKHSGAVLPPLPPGVTETNLSQLTKRQAGVLLTSLRELFGDQDR